VCMRACGRACMGSYVFMYVCVCIFKYVKVSKYGQLIGILCSGRTSMHQVTHLDCWSASVLLYGTLKEQRMAWIMQIVSVKALAQYNGGQWSL